MNIDAMNKLADLMEVIEPEAFDMGLWWSGTDDTICGTVGCLAGWAVHSNTETKMDCHAWNKMGEITRKQLIRKYLPQMGTLMSEIRMSQGFPYSAAARGVLGLHPDDANRLFEADSWWHEKLDDLGLLDDDGGDVDDRFSAITPKQAAIVLRALVNGEISFNYNDEADS